MESLLTRIGTIRTLCLLVLAAALAACAAPPWKNPVPLEEVGFKNHAETLTDGDVTVTVAIPNREETALLFGTSLYNDQIQPVWIEVDNRSDRNFILMKVGVDRMNFSPMEAAYQRHSGDRNTRAEMDRFFYSMDFENPILGRTVTSGFVFANLDEGHKAVNIDLVGNNELKTFSFLVKVPGLVTDASLVDFENLYDNWIDIPSERDLRDILESLPCCTRDKAGEKWGDPLNIFMIGHAKDIFSALIRSGWHQTEVTYVASIAKTVRSFLFGSRYRYSPISPLYVFGRPQDVGLQKARSSISLRNHMRLWLTQHTYRGKPIFLGQISRDIGVKFNPRTFTTHVIDPDVDDTRDSLIGDLAYSQSMSQVGFVKGSQVSTPEDTHYNLTPDPYYSDGLRAVMFFEERPTGLEEIDLLPWETTRLHLVK